MEKCNFTYNFDGKLMIFSRNYLNAHEVNWSFAISFDELLIRAHIWIGHKISVFFLQTWEKIMLEIHLPSLRQMCFPTTSSLPLICSYALHCQNAKAVTVSLFVVEQKLQQNSET